jgi:hypothetical protein
MTETDNKLGRLLELVFKAFILSSVVAIILPIPQYALICRISPIITN